MAGLLDDLENGIAVGLLGTLGVVERYHLVIRAVNDEHRSLITPYRLKGFHGTDVHHELPTQFHTPYLGNLRYVLYARITGVPVVGDAEGRVDEDEMADLLLEFGSRKGRDQTALALTAEHYPVLVYVLLLPEVADNLLQCLFLVRDGHLHGVVVTPAVYAAAGIVEGIDRITKVVERLEIVLTEVVGTVEAMADDGYAMLALCGRSTDDAIDTFPILLRDGEFVVLGTLLCMEVEGEEKQ